MGHSPAQGKSIEKIPISWEQVVSLCKTLATSVQGKGFRSILAIARGGLVPARILSTLLGDIPVWAITCQRYEGTQPGPLKITGTSIFKHLLPPVLVVDEICDAGKTLKTVSKLLTRKKIHHEIAVLVQKAKARGQVEVSYCAEVVKTGPGYPERWYCFPWEKEFFEFADKR